MSKKRGVAKDSTCSYHYLMASQVSCSLCMDGGGLASVSRRFPGGKRLGTCNTNACSEIGVGKNNVII